MKEQGFIVSALKYRPAEWSQVVGQDGITSTLQNAIESEEIAKAYLFCGPRGVGKTTCARIFAKAINSKYIEDGADLSFNVFELDAASNNSVDDIRQLIDQVRIQPQLGKYKVYIIDEVHMLSTQAFNAFLKTLEEPPPHAIFILATTEKHKVLPTILSRCQIYDFQRIQVKDIVSHLSTIAQDQGVTYEEEALHLIATKADGALRDALSLFDQMVSFTGKKLDYPAVAANLNVLDHEYFNRIVKAMVSGSVGDALIIYDEILSQGFDSLLFLIGLAEHLRNILVAKDGSTISLLDCPESVKQQYLEQANTLETKDIISHLSEIQKAEVNYRASKNKRLLTEITLMKLCNSSPNSEAVVAEKKKSSAPEKVNVPSIAPTKPAEQATQPSTSPVKPIAKSEPKSHATAEPIAPTSKQVQAKKEVESVKTVETRSSAEVSQDVGTLEKGSPISEKEISQVSEPRPRVKKSRRRRGVSLSDLHLEDEEETSAKFDDNPEKVEGRSIDPNQLKVAWADYAAIIQGQNKYSFYSTLVNRAPVIVDEHTIKITLENEVQMEHLNAEKAELMSYLREKLEHPGIRLEAEIDIEDKANIAYRTPREQYQDMMEKNPALRKLSQQFDLDLEF